MSWSGFKKNVGRATTQVMMKTGHVEKTNDREYEVEERRYRTLESASLRLQKEAKGYLDSLRAMTASQMRIAETIDAFYGDSGARDGVSRSYKQAVEDLDAETVKALDGPYRYISPAHYHVDLEGSAGVLDPGLKHEIEQDLNFKSKERDFTRDTVSDQFALDMKLMEFVYRTTVLEPINRFCAYFPDINECIKKRNHKMLDYDAMRAKVKKLVEKPDKDPTKLPRAEKETEMVGVSLLAQSPSDEDDLDLSLASPRVPDILQRLRRKRQAQAQEEDEELISRLYGMADGRGLDSSIKERLTGPSHRDRAISNQLDESASQPTYASSHHNRISPYSALIANMREGHEPRFNRSSSETIRADSHTFSSIPLRPSTPCPLPPVLPTQSKTQPDLSFAPLCINGKIHPAFRGEEFSKEFRNYTPFFGPSDLEEALRPHALHFIKVQTDKFDKAKQQYEQLNEQLTNELPQLIDLRVPYLDPSFEALVKIQLRFCAEAYSRMAQVQQYLDASTRDQYASGDLDARVEDVLGQIRELSIAGTV